MSHLTSKIVVKLLRKVPRPILVKLGSSRIGTKLVNMANKNDLGIIHEFDNGVKFYVSLTNLLTWDIMQTKDSKKPFKEMQVFLEHINQDDTVIDVGANIGYFSLMACKKVGPAGRVIAIEPVAETVTALKKNLELNNFKNYTVEQCAIGSNSSKLPLYKININATMGHLDPLFGQEKMIQTGEIEVKTIDEILSTNKINKVDMLKIDVEGHEYDALLGCNESLRQRKIKNILCEIHKQYLKKKGIEVDKIFSLLQQRGFSVNFIDKLENEPHILATLSKT